MLRFKLYPDQHLCQEEQSMDALSASKKKRVEQRCSTRLHLPRVPQLGHGGPPLVRRGGLGGVAAALAVGHAAQAEAHALALLVEADDLGCDDLARLEQIARLGLRVYIQLTGVDQPLDRLLDLDKRPERRD